MACSTFRVGDRVRFVQGNKDWIGCEGVVTSFLYGLVWTADGYFRMRLTKLTPALAGPAWDLREGLEVGLACAYMERCDGLLDV